MNNHHKIISLHGASPLKYGRNFFQKKLFMGTNFFGQQKSKHCKSLLEVKPWLFYKTTKGFTLKVYSKDYPKGLS